MEQPRRTQPSRNARSAPNTLSLTSAQSALNYDIPQVLERSMRRLAAVRQCTDVTTGPGILVKLFPVGDSNRTLWIVGSPHANKWTPSNVEDMRTPNANAKANDKAKASRPAKARPASTHKAKAQLISEKAVRQKKQGSRARGDEKVTEQQVQEGQDESDDMSNEQEGEEDEEEEDDAGEEDAGEEDAGEDIEEDLNDSEEEEDLEEGPEKDAVVNEENEHDIEEQDDDGHNEPSEQAETEEADKREDEEYGSEEDLAEDTGEKGEQEAEGQQEAEREGEREGEETTSDETEPHSETRGKDCAVHVGEEEEHGDCGGAGDEHGDRGNAQEVRGSMERQATANNRDGTWRSWEVGHTNSKESEQRCTNATGEETTAEDENGSAEEKRKRAFACSTPEERPNKRSKSDRGENEDDAPAEDSPNQTDGLNTQPRPRTPPLTSTTPSPSSTIEIVRQTSVIPGLEGTESAVWDAARRDAIFHSLSPKDQEKMVCTAVSLGSEKGIKELQRFVYNARRDVKRKGKSLESEFDLSASQSDADTRNADGTLIPRDRGLARFSALYQQIETLDKVAIKVSVTRRVKLAAMAQYRKGLLQTGLGRKQAKNANLYLFRAIHPEHATIERPDKAENSAALVAWERLRDRLREGRLWLDIREHFGGIGAFLALPPQCVSDRYVQKMQVEKFASWLRLLDVAWQALDAHARLTLNELVGKSLAGQPLPEGVLALEMLEDGTGTALNSLSGMLTGWPTSNRISGDACTKSIAAPTQREEDGNAAATSIPATTTSTTSRAEEAGDLGQVSQKKIVKSVEDGLFDVLDDLDFDESLSQEI